MPTYVIKNMNGEIVLWSTEYFPDSEMISYNIVIGNDGKPYKEGEEPTPSEDEILEEKLSEIDARYAAQYSVLKDSMASVQLIDGSTMDNAILSLRDEWNKLTIARDNEINQLLGG